MRPFEHNQGDFQRTVFTLRHIETGEFVCLRQSGDEYLAAFSDGDSAMRFRAELHLIEFVDVSPMRLGSVPFDHYYLDGELTTRSQLATTH
ncbi:hypothetical protein [Armatimonas sp.]|uniref:hypothetical protein n=1 Tax=Armatimonas sp. TaxID=1872638 RepID=UPI00286B3A7C|nr:hypothetical protein [Armatimonas sp.]